MGETWDRYRLETLLARGGMAEVFRASALDARAQPQTVCLKRVRRGLDDDPEFIAMFEREARLAAELDHPNIVRVSDFGRHDGQPFLVMEYVNGLDLRQVLQEVRELRLRLPVGLALYVGRSLLAALAHAHGHAREGGRGPVVHRDVSPHNLLISTAGEVKLTDFGVAKALGASSATRTGVIKGKLAYLSPEQAGSGQVGPTADLFCVGLVLYEMLAGQRFFTGRKDEELIAQVHRPATPRLPWVAPGLEALVQRLLAADPADRYPDAEAVLGELDELGLPEVGPAEAGDLIKQLIALRAQGESAGPQTHVSSQDIAVPRNLRERPRRLLRAAAVAAGVLVVAAGAYVLTGGMGGTAQGEEDEQTAAALSELAATAPATAPRPSAPPSEPVVRMLAATPPVPDATDSGAGEVELRDPPGADAAVGSGFLEVNCRPWAQVLVDGKLRGTTPLHRLRLPAGAHRVTLVNDELGYRKSFPVTVKAGRTASLNKVIGQ